MGNQEKRIQELLMELHQLDKKTKIRKLESDHLGNLLLDEKNPFDSEWYQNDQNYDVIKGKDFYE